jgi:hypothetical protein
VVTDGYINGLFLYDYLLDRHGNGHFDGIGHFDWVPNRDSDLNGNGNRNFLFNKHGNLNGVGLFDGVGHFDGHFDHLFHCFDDWLNDDGCAHGDRHSDSLVDY